MGASQAMELIRPAEAARRLGISRTTLWRLARQPDNGFPRPFSLAGARTTVFDGDELAGWVARQKQHRTSQRHGHR
jgi:predicted DNA-binding transcriptional regulator AlpA